MTESKPTLIPIGDIATHPQCQDRHFVDPLTVAEYAESDLDAFPPVRVFELDGKLVLAVGHHTLAAHVKAEKAFVRAVIHKGGTLGDAVLYAVKSNTRHGLRRTTNDKIRAVQLLLLHYPNWSTNQLAEAAAVSAHLVEELRKPAEPESVQSSKPTTGQSKRTAADGKKTLASKADATKQRERVVEELKANPERTLREIAKAADCAPETVRKVKAEQSAAQPTARETRAPEPIGIVYDLAGQPVPDALADVFRSDTRRRDIISLLKSAADLVHEEAESLSGFFLRKRLRRKPVKGSKTELSPWRMDEIVNAAAAVAALSPFAVCPYCAVNGKTCKADGCRGAGFLTEDGWKAVPKAVKAKAEAAREAL